MHADVLLCMRQTDSSDLLYSAGSYTLYPVITRNRKDLKKNTRVYICV